jgi:hypothetical protein
MGKKIEDLSHLSDADLWRLYQENNSKAKYFEEVRDLVTEILERFGRAANHDN